jgi:UDP-N-acetylglucosamine:LPS N-acetylglucosamine transferase
LAEALRDRLEYDFAVTVVDPQPTLIHTHYRLLTRYALWLWRAEYALSDTPRRALWAQRVFSLSGLGPMRRAIDEVDPDVVLSTYSFFNETVRRAVLLARRRAGLLLLLSDPEIVHSTWLTVRDMDVVLAPTRETQAQALKAGFAPDRVHLSGWPVRRQFREQAGLDRAALLTRLGLNPTRFTIFLQGGGEGAAKFAATAEALLALRSTARPFQIIVAAGTHTALRARFENVSGVHSLPFTKVIAPYMAAADVVMGKAGPNMLFEAVTLGKPFIATTFIPGQEEPNLQFIRRHGLGWVALDVPSQRELVQRLLADSGQMYAMAASVTVYRDWNEAAAATILPTTLAAVPSPSARRAELA